MKEISRMIELLGDAKFKWDFENSYLTFVVAHTNTNVTQFFLNLQDFKNWKTYDIVTGEKVSILILYPINDLGFKEYISLSRLSYNRKKTLTNLLHLRDNEEDEISHQKRVQEFITQNYPDLDVNLLKPLDWLV